MSLGSIQIKIILDNSNNYLAYFRPSVPHVSFGDSGSFGPPPPILSRYEFLAISKVGV